MTNNNDSDVIVIEQVTPPKNEVSSVIINNCILPMMQTIENDIDFLNDEGEKCPICHDIFLSDGDHQFSSLKCGHVFGLNCIRLWLLQNKENQFCPICHQSADKNDIRKLFGITNGKPITQIHKNLSVLKTNLSILRKVLSNEENIE